MSLSTDNGYQPARNEASHSTGVIDLPGISRLITGAGRAAGSQLQLGGADAYFPQLFKTRKILINCGPRFRPSDGGHRKLAILSSHLQPQMTPVMDFAGRKDGCISGAGSGIIPAGGGYVSRFQAAACMASPAPRYISEGRSALTHPVLPRNFTGRSRVPKSIC
jgi:hypothetical protein